MNRDILLHDLLADLLRYPAGDLAAPSRLIDGVCEHDPAAAADLAPLRAFCRTHRPEDLEELYTRHFDHTAEQALEVGWQLFGEQYNRGAFLVAMRSRLRACSVPESIELPDHLCHVLPVVARTDEHTAQLLAVEAALPAVLKVSAALEGTDSPYVGVLAVVRRLLESYRARPEPSHV